MTRWRAARVAMALAGAGVLAGSVPAHAQFSPGYRFLEAVKKKDGSAVTTMLERPGSTLVNARDATTGDTALHVVVQRRDPVWIRFLKEKGANLNLRNDKGESPLVLATNLGWTEGVVLLVALGSRVNEANSTGETPLIAATLRRDAQMARALLKAGADPRRSDNSGRSALDYAQLDGRGNPVLAEIEAAETTAAAKRKQATYGPSLPR